MTLRGAGLLLTALAPALLAGCPPPTSSAPADPLTCAFGPKKPAPASALIFNGSRAPSYVPLSAEQRLAVVGIGLYDVDSFCTGTLIAPDVVLTAHHCTAGQAASRLRVLFGPDDFNPELVLAAVEKREHDQLDLALLRLEALPSSSLDVSPIPIVTRPLGPADIGITLEQAGFGQTESGDDDGLYFVTERLWGYEGPASYLVVDGQGERGVCTGDSGGPSMRRNAEGEARVVGALGWGDYSCVDRDRYARVDVVRPWIEAWTGPTPEPTPVSCGEAAVVNACSLDVATAFECVDGSLRVTSCHPDEERCHEGRCVPIDDAPCGGETAFGRCDGEVLHWCRNGEPAERDCAACGEACAVIDPAFGATCVPSFCGALDEVGECRDDVATWCANGQVVTRDCTSEALTCAHVGELAGATCTSGSTSDSGCGDLDYLGRCDGDVAEWCEDGVRQQRRCQDFGQTCAYVDDEVGYYCVD